ncbi:IS66 family insertion sequence element accessory protein TnpB [Sorangium sp. So ce128]|uniref:IS66 family insertion sequence element accessory protein TnpB n=1 Tax=Sorangium sp. So ce128 TaxID=3133281 RepID=UPI003F6305B5
MIQGRVSIYVATEPRDLRRSFDGLAAVVREVLRQDPLSGALFLFFNRAADRCKALWRDRSGYCLHPLKKQKVTSTYRLVGKSLEEQVLRPLTE